jgi:hypothetical protein
MPVTDYLGWAATAVFVGSYFCTRAEALKRVQMVGALMWAAYGMFIGAVPVVAANLLVFGAAAVTAARSSSRGGAHMRDAT